jgi:hypothetical protein
MLPSWIDWSFVAAFAGVWPAYDNFVRLPRVKVAIDAGAPRIREYRFTMFQEWALVALALALIVSGRHSWAAVGFLLPHGAGLAWTVGIVALVAALLAMQYRTATGRRARAPPATVSPLRCAGSCPAPASNWRISARSR